MSTTHNTWLNLIDRSGPFLSPEVLEAALPQGLEAVQTQFRQKLRLAYEEWRDAVDIEDPQLAGLHNEWIKLVLYDILEFDKTSLILNSSGGSKFINEELGTEYAPTFLVKSPATEKIRFFIDVLPPDSDFEKPFEGDRWPASTVEKMTLLCRSQNVRYGLITNGEKWTIVSAPVGATSGTATWYSRYWRYEPVTLKAFQTLLGVRRCFGPDSGTLDKLLDSSLSTFEEVTNTLGEQVRRAVEVLIQSLDSADQDRNRELLDGIAPSELYDSSVTVMMRLVFLLCAEERGLLLLGDPIYDQFYAVTTLRAQLAEEAGKLGPEVLERRHDAWSRLLATFRAVYGGIEHESLRLPPLGGSLFDPDKYPFLEGRKVGSSWKDSKAAPLPIDNRTVLLLLTALQILEQKGGALHLSYRALDVEQIGHVYEGLLDSTVSRVPTETLSLIGSKKSKSVLLGLSVIETEFRKGKEAFASHLEEKLERKSASILRALNTQVTDHEYGTLILACGGDETLATRIKPFFHLLQMDIWGHPLVYKAGSYAVTLGLDRRESGTHYTPRVLTEEVVSATLFPVVYEIKPPQKEKLKSAKEILNLKVCDPAMGSAAFLVQACRWLSERLLQAWDISERNGNKIGLNGKEIDNFDSEMDILPPSTHDRLLIAKRLIAEKCLYGIDVNPLAVDLAKLSMWLITMSKGKPFDYLDHNFRHGDSLLGIHSVSQLTGLSIYENNLELTNDVSKEILNLLRDAAVERIENASRLMRDIKDVEQASLKNKEINKRLSGVFALAEKMTLEIYNASTTKKAEEGIKSLITKIKLILSKDETVLQSIAKESVHVFSQDLPEGKTRRKTFHWPVEFPEVFLREEKGFDAIIGNPPFRGGKMVGRAFGTKYHDYIAYIRNHVKGAPDFCAYFLLRAFYLLKQSGTAGMLATKSISQTGTRTVCLDQILASNGNIYKAVSMMPWPGQAAVVISIVNFIKGPWVNDFILDGEIVAAIDGGLRPTQQLPAPKKLKDLKGKYSAGQQIMGSGFELTLEEKESLLRSEPQSADLIKGLFHGQDINNLSEIKPYRWILNFKQMSEQEARQYPLAFERIEKLVKPYRDSLSGQIHEECFWKFWDYRKNIIDSIGNEPEVLASSRVTKYVTFRRVPSQHVYNEETILYCLFEWKDFAILQSSPHQEWAEWRCATMGATTFRYSTSAALETWPVPDFNHEDVFLLNEIGKQYHELRERVLIERNQGLTGFYNDFHNSKIKTDQILSMRDLQKKMDCLVMKLYGWELIDLQHGFYQTRQGEKFTVSPDAKSKIIDLLLKLNLERFERQSEKNRKSKDRLDADLGENE